MLFAVKTYAHQKCKNIHKLRVCYGYIYSFSYNNYFSNKVCLNYTLLTLKDATNL